MVDIHEFVFFVFQFEESQKRKKSMCTRVIIDIKAKTAKMYRKQINGGHLFVYDTLYVIPTFSNVDVKVKISFSFTFTIADFKLQTSSLVLKS